MARVVWNRMADIKASADPIPYTIKPSHEDFRPPSTIETDFQRLLAHDVPHVNWSFELVHNWYLINVKSPEDLAALTEEELLDLYARGTRIFEVYDEEDDKTYYYELAEDGTYEITANFAREYIRGQQTSIDWKSKIGNSDMSTNFKTDYTHKVQKGDYVIREDGALYMLNWNITLHANNQATQTVECNAIVDITREQKAVTDSKGYVQTPAGKKTIAPGLPISHSEYAGRPDYSGASGQAGMHPDHLITVYCQWNDTTRKIRLDDEFMIGDFTYRVINVSLAEVQVDRDYGVLTLNAKRVAGGAVSGYGS